MKQPTQQVLDLILEYEVGGGEVYYNKYLQGPTWPGGASGMTLAIGIDCGYYSESELANIFKFVMHPQIDLIKGASGKTGQEGREYTYSVKNKGIIITWDQAISIFKTYTWPKFAKLTESTFPGVDSLCDDAYGALVSLVFNRGSSLSGSSRAEMRTIRELVPRKDYRGIASELRSMKRIWEGKGLDGLLARREAEAKLVESCI
jgi:hypothetical protein